MWQLYIHHGLPCMNVPKQQHSHWKTWKTILEVYMEIFALHYGFSDLVPNGTRNYLLSFTVSCYERDYYGGFFNGFLQLWHHLFKT